jgi:Bifunctional DNA primase/polymerase, N-terminal
MSLSRGRQRCRLSTSGRGWAVVPVPHKSKGPTVTAWQNLRITEADAPRWFNGEAQNIGVMLGAPLVV